MATKKNRPGVARLGPLSDAIKNFARSKKNATPNLWAHVSASGNVGDTFCMAVSGGRLYRHEVYAAPDGNVVATTMCFVPEQEPDASISRMRGK